MSKYLCEIIGDGSEEAPYRPAIADYPLSWAAEIASGEDGKPMYSFCFVTVSAGDVSLFYEDDRIKALP